MALVLPPGVKAHHGRELWRAKGQREVFHVVEMPQAWPKDGG